jgi:hypothetical protein
MAVITFQPMSLTLSQVEGPGMPCLRVAKQFPSLHPRRVELRLQLGPEWVGSGSTFRHKNLPIRIEVGRETWNDVDERETRSATGWTVLVAERRVTSPTGEEHQLRLRYRVFEWVAHVVVAGPSDAIAAHRDELEAAALSGRPDWSQEVACLAQLFVDVDD